MSQPTEPRFFPQNTEIGRDGTYAEIESRLRESKETRLVEALLKDGQRAYLFFERGVIVGAYEGENDHNLPVSITELTSTITNGEAEPLSISLPDKARRMVNLALESQFGSRLHLKDADRWEAQVQKWNDECWSGTVEITSDEFAGFLVFWRGDLLKSEAIFSNAGGFTSELPRFEEDHGNGWDVVTYIPATQSPAYHCFILRRGTEQWSHALLLRYEGMVGRKLQHILTREMSLLIEPWQWNISFAENRLQDDHFFPRPAEAVDAYRTLFMEMGRQMSVLIGDTLTQRLFDETFTKLGSEERAALELHRLIPAAFSD